MEGTGMGQAGWVMLWKKYREPVLYLVFGGLTTLINVVSYGVLAHGLGWNELWSASLAWVISVLFAYLTNRRWVFQSRASGVKAVLWEAAAFFGGRLFSGGVDLGIMFLFVTLLRFPDIPVKLASNLLVILLNYILSKWLVFRK